MWRRRLLLSCVLLAAACSHAAPPYNYAGEPDPRKQEYVLGTSDQLRVNVWRNPDLSGEAIIRPDGTISLPLLGDIRAAGRTPRQVREEIRERLRQFVKDESAFVTVAVTQINSYRFTISGNVEHPGTFSVNHYVTVTEAIALAGGPSRYATPEEAVIIRNAGTLRRIPVDYPAILNGKKPDADLLLLAGDIVYVP